jgi:hypothetical protein
MQIFLMGWSTVMHLKEVAAKVGPPPSPSSPIIYHRDHRYIDNLLGLLPPLSFIIEIMGK